MAQYTYRRKSMAGHLQRANISDISSRLLEQMREDLNADGSDGVKPIAVQFEGGRLETFDLRGNPFTAQKVEFAVLSRRDADLWEVDAHVDVNTWGVLDECLGPVLDDRERDGWQLIGYYRGLNSATDMDRPATESVWDSVAVFTRRVT